jgi:hypothetical protein
MDGWPPITTPRFDGESEIEFKRRAARIHEIIVGFRSGRIAEVEADELESELMLLKSPDVYVRPGAALN